ncbi:LAMI_0C05072g1_1 [Lachancea mirantina]|uniref:Serine/threonine-protein kinase STE11 n=1 Tax=Lachancea mirantina TaxID=1230905 RepID=A0A1G4J2X1_9SACH|nr:LAMI_0C05072g1_1 [Lachancea mirantina]
MATTSSYAEGFLDDLGCRNHLDKFLEFGLTSQEEVMFLDQEILKEVGITSIGDRIKILQKTDSMRAKGPKHADMMKEVLNHFSALSVGQLSTSEELVTDKHSAIFILNDGSAKKVNVNGCFNADSIKKKLIKKLPREFIAITPQGEETRTSSDYDVFVVDYIKNVLHLLYDVELVTICHSIDRVEKNRLIFVSKDQTPSDKAVLTSKKLHMKTLSVISQLGSSAAISNSTPNSRAHFRVGNVVNAGETGSVAAAENLRIENNKGGLRQIFSQRPPSELISTNLAEYFPRADMSRLQKTLRNSVRHSMRLSTIKGHVRVTTGNNVGEILVNNANAVDAALLESLDTNRGTDTNATRMTTAEDTLNMSSPSEPGQQAQQAAPRVENIPSVDRIELYSVESSEESDDGDGDMISLPTKIATPKSWLKGARIGAGSFGSVYLGMNAQTGELMAVKQVELQPTAITAGVSVPDEGKRSGSGGNNVAAAKNSQVHRKMVDALQHEMGLLKELHHENIVTYFGSSQEGGNLNIFLEYVPGGSVSSMLNSYGPFEEPLIKNFSRQILIGLGYLHRKNIIHRDIKGANILIDIKGKVKITDFGISKKLSPLNQQQNKRASLQGSVYWMAPEVVKQVVTTEKADIWSVGCVIVEMFTGKHPFPDFSQMQAIFKIGTNTIPELPTWATEDARDFLLKTFELNYQKRPSSIELLRHSWTSSGVI